MIYEVSLIKDDHQLKCQEQHQQTQALHRSVDIVQRRFWMSLTFNRQMDVCNINKKIHDMR